MLYVKQGRFTEARPLLEKALSLEPRSPEREEFFEATVLNNLAEMHLGLRDLATAETLCAETLRIRERIGNPEKTGRSYITMGAVLFEKGELSGSEAFLKRAVANREEVYGVNHPEFLLPLSRYATLLKAAGRFDEEVRVRERISEISGRYSIPST